MVIRGGEGGGEEGEEIMGEVVYVSVAIALGTFVCFLTFGVCLAVLCKVLRAFHSRKGPVETQV